MKKLQHFLMWTLDTRVNPLAYLTAYASWIIGLFFTFFIGLVDVKNTLLFKQGVAGSTHNWALALFIAGSVLIAGLRFKSKFMVHFGSMGNFVLWIFAGIMYLSNQYWYGFLAVALFHVLCQGYFYLASALDMLWNEEYTRF